MEVIKKKTNQQSLFKIQIVQRKKKLDPNKLFNAFDSFCIKKSHFFKNDEFKIIICIGIQSILYIK